MGQFLNVCLYNSDSQISAEILGHLQALNFVRLVPEADSAEKLAHIVRDYEVSLIFFHVDPDPAGVLEVIDQVATRHPGIALIAISDKTDPKSILAPMRAGCDQFVCKPIDPSDLAAAVGRVASKRLSSRVQGRTICVTGASGGAGATSIACNLAVEIGQATENECALLDLNIQFGDAAMNFDVEPKFTLFDLGQAGVELDRAVLMSSLVKLPCRVSLIARPNAVEQASQISPESVQRVIELLTSTHENVVVDISRTIDECSYVAFKQADVILVVCQMLVPSIRNAQRFRDALTRTGIPHDRFEFIVNRAESHGSKRIPMEDLQNSFQKPVFATIPNDFQFIARSLDIGRPIAAIDHNSPIRSAIRKLAKRIVADPAATTNGDAAKRGILSRLFD